MNSNIKFKPKVMNEDELEQIRLHIAGATVRHKSPFEEIESYKNKEEISQGFAEKWVKPYYLGLYRKDEEWINDLVKVYPEISDEVILKNLGCFDWRIRSTGAFFAGIKDKKEYIDIIGTHLIKSEVCFAGRTYSKILALFNDKKGNQYLEIYLEYYLKKTDLYFDQRNVIEALKYLDVINETDKTSKYLDDWKNYVRDKENLDEEIDIEGLREEIVLIEKIKICGSQQWPTSTTAGIRTLLQKALRRLL